MNIQEIMTKNVITANPETPLTEVADIMLRNRFHGIPIIGEDRKILGIITETDFFTKSSTNSIFLPSYIDFLKKMKVADSLSKEEQEKMDKLFSIKAKDIMTADCRTVQSDMEVAELLEIFKKTKFSSVPVADAQKHLLGIITVADVINMIRV